MNLIWKRYFLIELTKVFVLFIGCFYFLYVLIDYSAHTKVFQSESISFFDVTLYYLYQFTKRADILIVLALMISTIKVLTTSNLRNEIVALVTGGIALKTLLRPFFYVALFLSAILYLNFEYLQPFSLGRLNAFEEQYFKDRSKDDQKKQVNTLVLEDNTLLIYQLFDQEKSAFFDVYWLKDADEIYRIQSLFPYEKIPFGKYVDILSRKQSGEIEKINSFEHALFPEIHFDSKVLFSAVHPPRWQSISQLVRNLCWKKTKYGIGKMSDREAEIATFLFHKLSIPLICILAVIGPAPFCLRFNRSSPIFFIYALSIFAMITFFTLVNTSVILGESQVIPPLWAILAPNVLFFSLLGWNYAKL